MGGLLRLALRAGLIIRAPATIAKAKKPEIIANQLLAAAKALDASRCRGVSIASVRCSRRRAQPRSTTGCRLRPSSTRPERLRPYREARRKRLRDRLGRGTRSGRCPTHHGWKSRRIAEWAWPRPGLHPVVGRE